MNLTTTEAIHIATRGHAATTIRDLLFAVPEHPTPEQYLEVALLALAAAGVAVNDESTLSDAIDVAADQVEYALTMVEEP